MEILSNEENSDIITWLDHGKGFVIIQKKRFVLEVMPKFFKQSKYTSFTRKLNRWGFTRVSRGPEMGAYYHRLFQRNNLRLCLQMACQPSKSSSPTARKQSHQSMNPSIYAAVSRQPMGMVMANTNNPTASFPQYDSEEAQRMLAAAAARRETMRRLARLQREQIELLRQQTAYLKNIEASQAPPQEQSYLHRQERPYLSQDAYQQQLDLLLQRKRSIYQNPNPYTTSFHSGTSQQVGSTPFSRSLQPMYNSQMTRSYLAMLREKTGAEGSSSTIAQSSLPRTTTSPPPKLDSKNQLSIYPNTQTISPQKNDDRVVARRASAA
mmetsp:Transcript_34503/g.52141  ORF Transcript_34503/g.52141 Transcript_34503/m.52141 type:complete len:323 (+) Transcript_34503:185-1153(+)